MPAMVLGGAGSPAKKFAGDSIFELSYNIITYMYVAMFTL